MMKIKLIDSELSQEQTREVLLNLIQNKITFHHQKDFSSQERFGKPDADSVKRIEELQEARRLLITGLSKLSEKTKLKVHSEIVIKPLKKLSRNTKTRKTAKH